MYLREAAKKVLVLVVRSLRGGGVKALVAGPLKKRIFFAASLTKTGLVSDMNKVGSQLLDSLGPAFRETIPKKDCF